MIRDRSDDLGVIELVKDLYPGKYIFSNSEWFGYDLLESRWRRGDTSLRKLIQNTLPEYFLNQLKPFQELYDEKEDENVNKKMLKNAIQSYQTFRKKVRDQNEVNSCIGMGKTELLNDSIVFDDNPDLFGCENGVWDFKEEVFRPYRYDDYITWSCKYDFTPVLKGIKYLEQCGCDGPLELREVQDDPTGRELRLLNEFNDVLEKIFPDTAVRRLVLKIFATGISGRVFEKFNIFHGNGRNGKGVLDEVVEVTIGDYCYIADVTILTERKMSSAGPNPEVAKIDLKRLVIVKEPKVAVPFQNNVVKDITGGGKIKARLCSSNKTEVRLRLTLIAEANGRPPFAETPGQAEAERIVDIHFPAWFTADEAKWDQTTGVTNHVYPVDPKFKSPEWRDEVKNTVLNMLVLNLLELKNEGKYIIDKYIPDSVRQRSFAYLEESNEVHRIFMLLFVQRDPVDACKYTDDNDWSLAKIAAHIKESKEYTQLSKVKQKEFNTEKIKSFFEVSPMFKGSVKVSSSTKQKLLVGWRVRPPEDA